MSVQVHPHLIEYIEVVEHEEWGKHHDARHGLDGVDQAGMLGASQRQERHCILNKAVVRVILRS